MTARIEIGDCRDVLRAMAPSSVDACVCDPPYGLSFMGKGGDRGVPGVEFWLEVLRVLKPGAHLVAFGGTRTYHRLTCAIEDAGFEIRDCLSWLYGSGFPKSHDVSKAIDKAAGNVRAISGEADEWNGWGTALKPAWEPCILARKPLDGTVAANVQQYGTGAMNIDGCRIETDENLNGGAYAEAGRASVSQSLRMGGGMNQVGAKATREYAQPLGRWPANVLLDEHAAALLDAQSGDRGASAPVLGTEQSSVTGNVYGARERVAGAFHADVGGASRFFYTAKAPRSEREHGLEAMALVSREDQSAWIRECPECGDRFTDVTTGKPSCGHGIVTYAPPSKARNHHPTVKPVELMRWLCKLVTPPPWSDHRSVLRQRHDRSSSDTRRVRVRRHRDRSRVCRDREGAIDRGTPVAVWAVA